MRKKLAIQHQQTQLRLQRHQSEMKQLQSSVAMAMIDFSKPTDLNRVVRSTIDSSDPTDLDGGVRSGADEEYDHNSDGYDDNE